MAELYSITLLWYHVVCVEDTATLSDGDTSQNRTKLYQIKEEWTIIVLLLLVRTADKSKKVNTSKQWLVRHLDCVHILCLRYQKNYYILFSLGVAASTTRIICHLNITWKTSHHCTLLSSSISNQQNMHFHVHVNTDLSWLNLTPLSVFITTDVAANECWALCPAFGAAWKDNTSSFYSV